MESGQEAQVTLRTATPASQYLMDALDDWTSVERLERIYMSLALARPTVFTSCLAARKLMRRGQVRAWSERIKGPH